MNASEISAQETALSRMAGKAASFQNQKWFRLIWASNPFYLISAALLLYGIYRVAIDPNIFQSELSQLFFNFGSLQVYEWLLVVTAIALARRAIDYESMLLFLIENAFVLIPFILVSHAVFLGPQASWGVCLMGGLFTIGQFAVLKTKFAHINLPASQLVIGLFFLAANILFPLLFRQGLNNNNEAWGSTSLYCWQIILPVLLSLCNFLPRTQSATASAAGKSWVPLLSIALWTIVSGVHLWTLNYVDDRSLKISLFLPLAWIGAWTLCNRIRDIASGVRTEIREGLLYLPIAILAFGLPDMGGYSLFVLTALNLLIFGSIFLLNPSIPAAFHGLAASIALLLASLPQSWGLILIPGYNRSHAVSGACAGLIFIFAVMSRNPRVGLLGGSVAIISAAYFLDIHHLPAHLGFQAGFLFFMLHSLRWNWSEDKSYPTVLGMVTCFWLADAWVAQQHGNLLLRMTPILSGALLLFGAYLHSACTGRKPHWILPATAAALLFSIPVHCLVGVAMGIPKGVFAVIASFILFAMGTLLAFIKGKAATKPKPLP